MACLHQCSKGQKVGCQSLVLFFFESESGKEMCIMLKGLCSFSLVSEILICKF